MLARGRFLLDTNVVSHVIRRRTAVDAGIARFFESVGEERVYISSITVGEIQKGIDLVAQSGDERLRAQLEQRLDMLCERFDGRIVVFDVRVARQWGRLHAERQRVGKKTPVVDTMIAACAYVNQLIVASVDGNFSAFTGALSVYNPKTGAFSQRA